MAVAPNQLLELDEGLAPRSQLAQADRGDAAVGRKEQRHDGLREQRSLTGKDF